MARLDLSTRAARIAESLAGRSLDALPKYLQQDLERFTRAIGIDVNTFTGYAPSTQRRYINAAKKGRTAAQERERVRQQRAARPKKPKRTVPARKTKLEQITELQQWLLRHGLNTELGTYTKTDNLRSQVLLSDEAIEAHVRVYGEQYVLDHLKNMKEAMIDKRFATARWQAFKASEYYQDDVDERWWWYHSSALHYSGDVTWGSMA